VSELAEEGRAGPSRSRSWADAAPEAPERPRPRRARAGSAANPRPGDARAAPGRWAMAPAAGPADALVQAGFGQQLLSMRLGEGGLGLSLGARLPARAPP